jgi:dihydrofolate reductase
MSLNRVIGNQGKIPWHLPEDFKWFKKTTMGGNLLMGRTTFDSIGKALPGRTTYVLTNDEIKLMLPHHGDMIYVNVNWLNFQENSFWEKTWLCGGANVYQQYLHQCTDVYLTIVLEEYEGDAFLPEFEHHFPNSELIAENSKFWIVHYFK